MDIGILYRGQIDTIGMCNEYMERIVKANSILIDSKYYAIGYLNAKGRIEVKTDTDIIEFEIITNTLCIGFDNLKDKNDRILFASLNKYYHCGDIVKGDITGIFISPKEGEVVLHFDKNQGVVMTMFGDGEKLFAGYTIQQLDTFNDIEVIGQWDAKLDYMSQDS